MGKRGPTPTPTAILKKRGSWRGKYGNQNEPQPKSTAPKMPENLSDAAKSVWTQTVDMLGAIGVLAETDGNALERYCQALVRWRTLAKFIDENGEVSIVEDDSGKTVIGDVYPQVAIYLRLFDVLRRHEQEFGLTPASRSRIQVDVKGEKPKASKDRFFPNGPALKIA